MQPRPFEGPVPDVDLGDFAHFIDIGIAGQRNHVASGNAAILSPQVVFVAKEISRSFSPLGEKTHGLLGLTEVLSFSPAEFAEAAGDRTDHYDAVTDADVVDAGASLNDLAQPVVANGHRKIGNRLHLRAVLHSILAHVQVAMIETRPQHANQYLAGADIRNGHVIDANNFARAMGALEAMQTSGFYRTVHGQE